MMPFENKQISAKGGADVILENNNYISINKDGSIIIKYSGIAYTFNKQDGFEKLFQSIDDQKVDCVDKIPFMEACLYGIAKPKDIDFYVEYWHTHNIDMTLREFLDLSKKEYELWCKSDDATIEEFLDKRRAMHAEGKKMYNKKQYIKGYYNDL